MSLVINSGGLGGPLSGPTYKIDCSGGATNGQLIDCGTLSNFFNATCWDLCDPSALAPGITAPVGGASSPGGAVTPPPVVSPSVLCNVLDCDSTGNVLADSNNVMWVMWIGGGALLLWLLFRGFK